MHSNVTIKNVSWPYFSWPTLYITWVDAEVDKMPRHVSLFIADSDTGKCLATVCYIT